MINFITRGEVFDIQVYQLGKHKSTYITGLRYFPCRFQKSFQHMI